MRFIVTLKGTTGLLPDVEVLENMVVEAADEQEAEAKAKAQSVLAKSAVEKIERLDFLQALK